MPWKQPTVLVALAFALAAGAAAPSSRHHDTPPAPSPAPGPATLLTLACGERWRSAHGARLAVEMPEAVPAPAPPQGTPGQLSSLHLVRISWSWLPLADDEAGYGRVTVGVTAAPGTVLDLYPHGMHAPRPVDGALSVDAQQRLQVVPKGPGTIPIAASTERLGGRRSGGWAYWSVAAHTGEVLAPGHASAYVLLQVPPGQTHVELRLRSRARVGNVRFGRLRSVGHAEAEEQVFSLPVAVPATPGTSSSADAGHAKRREPR